MVRKIFTVIITLHSILIYSQNSLYNSGDIIFGSSELDSFTTRYQNFNDLPPSINDLITKVLKSELGENYYKIDYQCGFKFDLGDYFKNYPDNLNNRNKIVPTYELFYSGYLSYQGNF